MSFFYLNKDFTNCYKIIFTRPIPPQIFSSKGEVCKSKLGRKGAGGGDFLVTYILWLIFDFHRHIREADMVSGGGGCRRRPPT